MAEKKSLLEEPALKELDIVTTEKAVENFKMAEVAIIEDGAIENVFEKPSVREVVVEENKNENTANLVKDSHKNGTIENVENISDLGKKEIVVENIDLREKELLDVLTEARNNFAKTEYGDRTRMNRIRKALNMSLEGNEENPNIESARKPYEDALRQHMEYQVDKLKAGGLDAKSVEVKVKEIYSFFNLNEATQYYDARTQAKMTYLAQDKDGNGKDKNIVEKSWDFARLKSTQISEWYSKKVPTSVKLGLAAATFIPGASTFALGKRTWGAFMMVAAGGMQLDKLAQFKDAMSDKLERNKEFKNISQENGEVDFEKLKDLLGGKIDNIDSKLNEKNLRSGANKLVAFAGALFLGGSVFKGAMDFAEGKEVASTKFLGKLFSHKAESPVSGDSLVDSKLPKIPTSGVFATPLTDSMEHPSGTPVNIVDHKPGLLEALHTPESTESLTIEKGSSIERTLINYYKSHGLKFDDNGYAAHHAYRDYMTDYIDHNKEALIKSGKLAEYQQMLKDGMVNIKPGTEMVIDPHTGHIISIDGKLSHLHTYNTISGVIGEDVNEDVVADVIKPLQPSVDDVAKKVVEELNNQKAVEIQQHIATGQKMFADANADYGHAANEALMHPANGDGPSVAQYEAMGHTDKMREAAVVTVENAANAKELYWNSIKESTTGIYKVTGYKWTDIKDLDYSNAYADDKLRPIIKQMTKEYTKEFGNKPLPKYNDTLGKWLYRVKELTIKKRLGINIE